MKKSWKQEWDIGGRRLDGATRKRVLETYLADRTAGEQLARSLGLSPLYAYKLANASGLLPGRYEVRP